MLRYLLSYKKICPKYIVFKKTLPMSKKILLVEDDGPIASALKLKLENSSFEVDLVTDGKEALEHITENDYDLVLLDLIMPNMDGFETLEEAKKQKIKVPFIVLSNLGQDEDIKKAKELGAKDYFIKSDIDLSQVIEKINAFLKK